MNALTSVAMKIFETYSMSVAAIAGLLRITTAERTYCYLMGSTAAPYFMLCALIPEVKTYNRGPRHVDCLLEPVNAARTLFEDHL